MSHKMEKSQEEKSADRRFNQCVIVAAILMIVAIILLVIAAKMIL